MASLTNSGCDKLELLFLTWWEEAYSQHESWSLELLMPEADMFDKLSANSIAKFGPTSSFSITTATATYMVCKSRKICIFILYNSVPSEKKQWSWSLVFCLFNLSECSGNAPSSLMQGKLHFVGWLNGPTCYCISLWSAMHYVGLWYEHYKCCAAVTGPFGC